MAFIENHRDFGLLIVPSLYSTQNPFKINVEPLKIFSGTDQLILSNKDITFDTLLTGEINLGVPFLGGPQHMLALKIKEKNPKLEIVPLGGDAKAMTVIMNKDVDAYISSVAITQRWVDDFKFKALLKIPVLKTTTYRGITFNNLTVNTLFVHKDASPTQKAKLLQCLDNTIASPSWDTDLKALGVTPLNISGSEMESIINTYIDTLKKNNM
jgi:tripartite-type tricarboxylate transporter receptor subunit TctC